MFIRFAGCNLKCAWCDTKYAQEKKSGGGRSVSGILKEVRKNGCRNVTITGGEPFMQKKSLTLLCDELIGVGYHVSVETNGSYNFQPIEGVDYVVDFKLPSSKEYMHMKVNTPWMHLRENDWIKFVIADNPDYETACATINMLDRKGCKAQYAMSPVLSNVSANRLMQWLRFDRRFNVVISLQLHKLVDLSEPD